MDGSVANEVEIVQHQRPRAVIMRQCVDQAGNGFGKRVIRVVSQLFTQIGRAGQAGLLKSTYQVLPESPGLIIVFIQREPGGRGGNP